MTKLCIRKNRSIFLQKYVIGANAETLAYDLIIYAFQNLSLNCQFNDIFQNIVPAYLVNLATCYIPAVEVTSHPHLGGDDNANPFRTTEALRGEPYL